MSNAIKFTPAGGSISIIAKLQQSAKLHSAESDNDIPKIRISVSDTGIGISAKDLPRVFNSFEQLDNYFTKKLSGTGLGLALTKKLVEFHGGEIWAESAGSGKGSKFSFTIPLLLPPGT